LHRRKWSQHRFSKAFQLPVLLLIGVGAAGNHQTHLGKDSGKLLHGSLDPHAALVSLRHFVQAVEQQEPAFATQDRLQRGGKVTQRLLGQLGNDELPEGIAVDLYWLSGRR